MYKGITLFRLAQVEYSNRVKEDPRICKTSGCDLKPSERKPYCIKHLEELPYIQRLHEEITLREAKRAPTRVKLKSPIPRAVVSTLRHKGAMSPGGLAREMGMRTRVLNRYLKTLKNAGQIKILDCTKRGGRRKVVDLK